MKMERPANGLPEDLREHSKLMCDIIAMAFQTDKTRVASLIYLAGPFCHVLSVPGCKPGTPRSSHNNNSDTYEAISRWHVSQFAYLASKLDSMPEGDGTVLDNSCLMFLSSLFVGRTHDNNRLPVVLAGGLGGTLKTDVRSAIWASPRRIARCAACTFRSWIAWASSWITSATPIPAWLAYNLGSTQK